MNPGHETIAAAEAHYRAGDYAAAAVLLAPLAGEDAPAAAALRVLGLCRLRLGAPSDALDCLERARAIAPDDPLAMLQHGVVLRALGRHAEAAAMFAPCLTTLPDDPAPALNLASSLLGLGDVRGAIRIGRKARLRWHAMPQAHYVLGTAYLAGDMARPAVDCFRRAVALAPQFVEAWVSLGVAWYQNGDIARAVSAMRSALDIDPGNAAAAANLGGFMRLTGEPEAAEILLRDALARRPDAPAVRLNLAAGLLHEDRARPALALLKGPPPDDPPARQHWLLQRALALIILGRLKAARTALDAMGSVPAPLEPMLRWRRVLLSRAEGNADQAMHQAEAMAASLENTPSMLPEHRIMGHYDLAKFWSGLGQPDRAFPRWVAGHRLLAVFQPFSRADYGAFVDATIARFDAARMGEGARAANRDETPVFIVGMPRSGTTLIEQILSAHKHVHGAGERTALGAAFHRVGGHVESAAAAARIALLDAPVLDSESERYLRDLHAIKPRARRIVDKMPGNFRHLGLAGLLLPGARIIACERDPRDIGLSIFTYRFFGSHGYAHDLGDLGWYIGQQHRLMAHWRAVLRNPVLTVRLRDWVEDFPGTLRRVLEFLDLPYDAACERFHEVRRRVRTASRAQVREPVNARGLGRWRAYERHLAPLIASLREAGVPDDGDR